MEQGRSHQNTDESIIRINQRVDFFYQVPHHRRPGLYTTQKKQTRKKSKSWGRVASESWKTSNTASCPTAPRGACFCFCIHVVICHQSFPQQSNLNQNQRTRHKNESRGNRIGSVSHAQTDIVHILDPSQLIWIQGPLTILYFHPPTSPHAAGLFSFGPLMTP
jgi:hypothetical protein